MVVGKGRVIGGRMKVQGGAAGEGGVGLVPDGVDVDVVVAAVAAAGTGVGWKAGVVCVR
jgi:hypothetical protein